MLKEENTTTLITIQSLLKEYGFEMVGNFGLDNGKHLIEVYERAGRLIALSRNTCGGSISIEVLATLKAETLGHLLATLGRIAGRLNAEAEEEMAEFERDN